jgi:hypothetical protein
MNSMRRTWIVLILSVMVGLGLAGCKFIKKQIRPPNDMFLKAEELRKGEEFVAAAQQYDDLVETHTNSELAPAALYYAGLCKYTLSLRCPGKAAFEQQKAALSKSKKDQYQDCLNYLEKQKASFTYAEAIDKYIYTGVEFDNLIKTYTTSDLLDDAAFQRVRVQIVEKQQLNSLTVALMLQFYADFFERYPHSQYRQNGLEDLLKLVSEYSGQITEPPAIAETYQKFLAFTDDFPDLAKLSALLARKLMSTGDKTSAGKVLGLPSLVGIGIVTTQQTNLNIRRGQGTQYQVVGKAPKGAEVLVLDATGDWYQIQMEDGTRGYVNKPYIELQP